MTHGEINDCRHVQECILSECRVCGPEQQQGICTYGCPSLITITRAVQTCWACPSQWDTWDADGNYYYLRYRWGSGGVYAGTTSGSMIASFDTGDLLDGMIELDEFCERAGIKLELT